jgi:hypothetical protein
MGSSGWIGCRSQRPESFNQRTSLSGNNAVGSRPRMPTEPYQDSASAIHDADAGELGGEGQPLINRRRPFP